MDLEGEPPEEFAPPNAGVYDPRTLPNAVAETTTNVILDIGLGGVIKPSNDLLLPLDMRDFPRDLFASNDKEYIEFSKRNQDIVFGELTESMKNALDEETYSRLYNKAVNKSLDDEEDGVSKEKAPKKTQRKGTLRDFFEPSTPVTQCNNTIKSVNARSICWICETEIYGGESYGFEFNPECEHVFPVMQALCFTGLYSAGVYESLKDQEDEEGRNRGDLYKEELTREYRWSHRICNQVKSNAHFIIIGPDGKFGIEVRFIKELLYRILGTTSYGGGNKLWSWISIKNPGDTKKTWVDKQSEKVRVVCQQIIDKANSLGLTKDQFLAFSVMKIREYVAMDPEIAKPSYPPADIWKTMPTSTGSASLYQITTESLTPVLKFYAKDIHRVVTGIISTVINQSGRKGTGLTALQRAEIFAELAGSASENAFIERVLKEENVKTYKEVREALYSLTYRVHGMRDQRAIWSDIQTMLPVVLYSQIMADALNNIIVTFSSLGKVDAAVISAIATETNRILVTKISVIDGMMLDKYKISLSDFLANRQSIIAEFRNFTSAPQTNYTRPAWYGEGRKTKKQRGKRNRRTYRRKN